MKFIISYTFAFSIITCLVLMGSCAKDKASLGPKALDTIGCIKIGDTITYTGDVKRIMETYCTGTSQEHFGICHQSEADGGTPGLDFTSYAGIKEKADDGKLIERVVNDPASPMPSILTTGPQKLSDCDFVKIQAWVEDGAVEN
ncbi:MAG: hypothetical protein IPO83_09665 [Chitinophagaceae bacterium]|nr:hypothetical protein [Chitinophagaceae bacterium]